ncbi:MAG: carbamate kinase [Gammaproteobacteria bacterium]
MMADAPNAIVVVALGGNALLARDETPDTATQRGHARAAVAALAPLARTHRLVVTHGNGPQVGLLALAHGDDGTPLDVLDAETEGMLGYLLAQELDNALPRAQRAVALLTQVEVAADDAAFAHPDKPIGPVYASHRAAALGARHGWTLVADGAGVRRTVASPRPLGIVELDVIELLVAHGVVVICAGGGGIPVARRADGLLAGVPAVVDKDLASSLLARSLGAAALLLLTDVAALYDGHGTTAARAWREIGSATLARYRFAPGTMAPKVAACREFVDAGGGFAAIGSLDAAAAVLAGRAGTRIVKGDAPGRYWT